MRTHLSLAFVVLGLLFTQAGVAAPQQGGAAAAHEFNGGTAILPDQIKPQFNDPGPQIRPMAPGNPMQQLSPLDSAGPPDSLGIK